MQMLLESNGKTVTLIKLSLLLRTALCEFIHWFRIQLAYFVTLFIGPSVTD